MILHWIKRCACGELLRKTKLVDKISCTSCHEVWQEVGISNVEIPKTEITATAAGGLT